MKLIALLIFIAVYALMLLLPTWRATAALAAAAAFGRDREDILRALNRLSSLVYILMLQCKGETSP